MVSQPADATRRPLLQAICGSGQWKRLETPAPSWRPRMPTQKPKDQTKSATVIALLNRGKGASIDEICKATKWQKHSTRAFLTGLRKKGLIIIREQRGNEGTVYRVTETPNGKTQQAAS
ncbi:MAG: DUF3489 domain-containing protein [Sphingomonadales bacterium]|nr:DUF3489 domain-containing protein [Sphingomonadales bacterium]